MGNPLVTMGTERGASLFESTKARCEPVQETLVLSMESVDKPRQGYVRLSLLALSGLGRVEKPGDSQAHAVDPDRLEMSEEAWRSLIE